MEQKVNYMGQ